MSIIHTARLTLGRHTPADFEDCAAMWANPEVTRYIGGIPSTRSECWDRLVRFAGNWALFGYGYWAVRETETGATSSPLWMTSPKSAGCSPRGHRALGSPPKLCSRPWHGGIRIWPVRARFA